MVMVDETNKTGNDQNGVDIIVVKASNRVWLMR
jgi:hypothetical protein